MNNKDIGKVFEKQGGKKLIERYAKSGALFTAVCEFLLLGKDRTALELLRLCATFKTKKKLCKKYESVLNDFDRNYDDSLEKRQSNKIWVCWLQGMENAPAIVKRCYESLKNNLSGYEIIVITSENLSEYVEFPEHILKKWKEGKISFAHLTDMLRLELLIKYGGTWIDSTVFCTRNIEKIPKYFLESELFMFQTLKPGRDGHATTISNWYISACTNNKVIMAMRHLLYEYWKRNDDVVDYYIFHEFMAMVLEKYPDKQAAIVPFSNSTPHILLLRLFDKFDESMYESILEQTPFHKLTYKFDEEQTKIPDTYYQRIVG